MRTPRYETDEMLVLKEEKNLQEVSFAQHQAGTAVCQEKERRSERAQRQSSPAALLPLGTPIPLGTSQCSHSPEGSQILPQIPPSFSSSPAPAQEDVPGSALPALGHLSVQGH